MAKIEAKLQQMGLALPAPLKPPAGLKVPIAMVKITGTHAYVSGHAPLAADGSLANPKGKVGGELTVEQGYQAARLTALAMLASLKRELGDLDRVTNWLKVLGMVNVAPTFNETPRVINGFSDLIVELYGKERGLHTRSAVGMAALPFNIPVEIEAEVEISK
ncbi:MAG: RidA family protein [SAR202 cluster bacterium]|nr:RidA family protein [SAR202 cluster bacterium]